MVVGCTWIGALAKLSHASNCGDRARCVVPSFGSPSGDRAVVHGRPERQIGFDVPFQVVQQWALSLKLLDQIGMVAHVVQDGEPVTWRRLRIRTVRPKLGQDPGIVSPGNQVGRIRRTRRRVDAVTWARRTSIGSVVEGGVGLKRVGVRVPVSACGGTDVPHHPVCGVKESGPKGDHCTAVDVDVGRPRTVLRKQGWWAWVVIHLVFKTVAGVGCQIVVVERPRSHLPPLR